MPAFLKTLKRFSVRDLPWGFSSMYYYRSPALLLNFLRRKWVPFPQVGQCYLGNYKGHISIRYISYVAKDSDLVVYWDQNHKMGAFSLYSFWSWLASPKLYCCNLGEFQRISRDLKKWVQEKKDK